MTDLVIYGTPVSPFVRKVEAVLKTQGLVVSTAFDARWPALARDTEVMKSHVGSVENLTSCRNILSKLVPEKVGLS